MLKSFYAFFNLRCCKIIISFLLFTQITKGGIIDSLIIELSKAKVDTTRIDILNKLSWENKFSAPDTAIFFAENALALSEKIKFIKGSADAGNNLGVIQYLQGNYHQALPFLEKALLLRKQLLDKKGMAKIYNNLGLINSEIGNYPRALEFHFASLKISEELGNQPGIAASLNNMGNIYSAQGNFDKALEYFFKSTVLNKTLNDRQGLANNYNNIGTIYSKKENTAEALKNYFTALQLNKEANNKAEENNIMINIGNIYMNNNQYDDALDYLTRAMNSKEEMEDNRGVPGILLNIGYIYLKQGDKITALDYMNRSLQRAKEMQSVEDLKEAYHGKTDVYESMKNYKEAFINHNHYIDFKDSILNADNSEKIAEMQLQYQTEKKDREMQLMNEKNKLEQALAEQEIKRQKLLKNSFFGGFGIVMVFSILVYRQRNKIAAGKKRSDELLLNILPEETAEELKATGSAKTKSFEMVTVLFTDFKNFTQASEKLTPEELVEEINACYSEFDKIITRHGIEKIKTIGDAYMCAGGLPATNESNPVDVVQAGLEIVSFIERNKEVRMAQGKPYFELRCGIHTGPVVAGIVGIKKFAYDIWGDTVNIASRMESSGEPGKVNISETTYQLVKDKFNCFHRGKIEARNKGMVDMYFVERK